VTSGIEFNHKHTNLVAHKDAGKGEQPQVDIDASAVQDLIPSGRWAYLLEEESEEATGRITQTEFHIITFKSYS